MKTKVWILNHYASSMFFNKGGRHHELARNLIQSGCEVKIFSASTVHNTSINVISDNRLFCKDSVNGISYIFIRSRNYKGNGGQRVLNMIDYYKGLFKVAEYFEHPDVIIGSSVHPLACVAAIKLSKKYACKNIIEIRDLWPESLISYGIIKRNSLIAKCLYAGEKWIYKKANAVVMTWPGGYDYIVDRKWDRAILNSKVFYISNGVDLDSFYRNVQENKYDDSDLNDGRYFKAVYTGSIRIVNNLSLLVDTAQWLQNFGYHRIKIIIFGDGNDIENLTSKVEQLGLGNIVFKGKVEKKYIPSILSQADVSILHNSSTELDKYGQSQNKFFEYLAAGKPVLMTYSVGYSICKEKNCGIEIEHQDAKSIAQALVHLSEMPARKYQDYCSNAEMTANEFDYKVLTKKMVEVINFVLKNSELSKSK